MKELLIGQNKKIELFIIRFIANNFLEYKPKKYFLCILYSKFSLKKFYRFIPISFCFGTSKSVFDFNFLISKITFINNYEIFRA